MARLIDAEAAVELLRRLGSREYRRKEGTIDDAMKMLFNPRYTPTIDPESLRPHGRWDDKGYCTNCGQRCIGNDCEEWRTKYCPHCGAKMKGSVVLD